MSAVLDRVDQLMAHAPFAPAFVRAELDAILRRELSSPIRERVRARREVLMGDRVALSTWSCRFPAVISGGPARLEGGVLTILAVDPGVAPIPGASWAAGTLPLGALDPRSTLDLHLSGMPGADLPIDGRSGSAAAWLAARARATGRRIPDDVVLSADLVPGPDGIPRLAEVDLGGAKARIVARELPGATLYLCGDPEGEVATILPPGTAVTELERLLWGDASLVDRAEVLTIAGVADKAFREHDYTGSAERYRTLLQVVGGSDGELVFEAHLRLAAIAVHEGRGRDADEHFRQADGVELPATRRSYRVERLAGLAGAAIDAFRPREAEEHLGQKRARSAADDPEELWDHIQVMGAWRRLRLLEGRAEDARTVQRGLLQVTDEVERPRVLIDLGFVELRCGDLVAAGDVFRAARTEIRTMAPIYRLQSEAFLTWHVARLANRGGRLAGLEDLLGASALDALIAHPRLEAAGRWRARAVRALRAEDRGAMTALRRELTAFQRWYLGVFLLECEMQDFARETLAAVDADLSGMPMLAQARVDLRAGRFDPMPFVTYAAY